MCLRVTAGLAQWCQGLIKPKSTMCQASTLITVLYFCFLGSCLFGGTLNDAQGLFMAARSEIISGRVLEPYMDTKDGTHIGSMQGKCPNHCAFTLALEHVLPQ